MLLSGEIKSYRLAVVKHQEVKLDGVRLMKHHLPMHNIHCGSGNFTDVQRLAICEVAETFVNCDDMFTLVHSVLEYTIILWATIGFGELKPAQARYYLLHGGEDRKTEAYIAMERKFFKKRGNKASETSTHVPEDAQEVSETNENEEPGSQEYNLLTRGDANTSTKSIAVREAKQCPACSVTVLNLPRHMRNMHKWRDAKAKHVTTSHSLRKVYSWKGQTPSRRKSESSVKKSSSSKDYHVKRHCPVAGCFAVCVKMYEHLSLCHHLEKEEKDQLLSVARAFKPGDVEDRSLETSTNELI